MTSQALSSQFKDIVENVFNRWTALKLAVEHGMGGPLGVNVNFLKYLVNQ